MTTNAMHPAPKRQAVISALLLCLVFVACGSASAQRQTAPIARKFGPAAQRVVGGPRGPLVLNPAPSSFRPYDIGDERTAESLAVARSPISVPVQAAPLAATPIGTFGLPPVPGLPQTPTVETLRGGNINLGALAAWLAKRDREPGISVSPAVR